MGEVKRFPIERVRRRDEEDSCPVREVIIIPQLPRDVEAEIQEIKEELKGREGWRLAVDPGQYADIIDINDENYTVATSYNDSPGRMTADAAFIASAPARLRMLIDCIEQLQANRR